MKIYKLLIFLVFLINNFVDYSYSQDLDSLPENFYSWQLDEAYQKNYIELDTIIDNFHIYNPIDQYSIFTTSLGNLGSENKSNIFFSERENNYSDFIFDETFEPFLLTAQSQKYYFSKKPHFDLKYIMGKKQKNENTVNALYTQNINEKWNLGVNYRLYSSAGEFANTQTSLHSYNAFLSYIGSRYSMHASFVRNKFRLEENGGIIDTVYVSPEFTEPRLSAASSIYYKRDFFVSQEYKFGTKSYELVNDTTNKEIFHEIGRINYVFNIENNYRKYTDASPVDSFYRNIYLDSLKTSDSLNLRLIENTFIWTFKEITRKNIKFRTSFGSSLENMKYYSFKGYIFTDESEYYTSAKAVSDIFGKFGKIAFAINAKYYFYGFKNENYTVKFNFYKLFGISKEAFDVYLKTKIEKTNPLLYEQSNYSNNFIWENSFKEKTNTSLRFGVNIPSIHTKIEFAAGKYQNYVYFGLDTIPHQLVNNLNIISFRAHKDFNLWRFKSKNKIIYQFADNEDVMRLPQLAIYHSLYYESFFFKKALFAQIGYELRYSTAYKSMSYMPATGQFYLSDDINVGEYPVINAFLNMKIREVSLFIKFEHINGQFLGNEYAYNLNHYPINSTAFKFGAFWRFND
ncbi:MAG: hypothetical protein JXR51_09340 [Bacteroidales bacterium]|nr:hypothetical protein [Bacteroidales bacterium]